VSGATLHAAESASTATFAAGRIVGERHNELPRLTMSMQMIHPEHLLAAEPHQEL
jgi:hypothetical protein